MTNRTFTYNTNQNIITSNNAFQLNNNNNQNNIVNNIGSNNTFQSNNNINPIISRNINFPVNIIQ
jgi:hypothetical protein